MSKSFTIHNADSYLAVMRAVREKIFDGLAGGPVVLTLSREKRNAEQNALMWAMLTDVSMQVEWYGKKLKKEDWKDLLSAAVKGQEMIPGINGGFVAIGQRTSQMTKQDFSDLIDYIKYFGDEKQIKWSDNRYE